MTLVISFLLQRERITRELCVNVNRPELDCKGKCYLAKQFAGEGKSPERTITMHPLQVMQLGLPPDSIRLPFFPPTEHFPLRIPDPGLHDSPWHQDIDGPPWMEPFPLS